MTLGLLVALENANKVLSDIQRIFNTGPYGDPPLKIKILKIGLRHVLSWPKLSLEPKCHDPGTFFFIFLAQSPKKILFLPETRAKTF